MLRWKAKYASASAATSTERVDFALDGSITDYRNPTEIRSTQTRYTDAHNRPTSEGSGFKAVCNGQNCGIGPTVSTKRRFDGADNMTRLGLPFNLAPDFCTSDSTLCSWMTYDRAERLAGVDMHPDSSAVPTANSTRTCFEYDDHGNVKRAATGCSGATGEAACPINKAGALQSSCAASATDYEHDDFGNPITVTFPWTSEAARAVTRYEYDPRGNLVRKQTAEMRAAPTPVHIQHAYDQMGRLTVVSREGGASVTLYSLGYDNDEPVRHGCGGPLVRSNGRLALRNDSFGKTWYRYDEEGRVTQETRLRAAYPTFRSGYSGTTAEDRSPTTSYSYDLNGNLRGIIYPHGRAVEYVYSVDRPITIKHSSWTGSAWNSTWDATSSQWTGTPTTVIDNITWEPYGGLRGYRLFNSEKWVEYYRGGSLETAPTQTACVDLPATYSDPYSQPHDKSGRLRGLFVSDPLSGGGSPLGAPNGMVFKQVYTWKADMLTYQHTCHRNGGNVVVDQFAYDRTLRLTGAATNGAPSVPADFFAYDARGNRNSMTLTGPACTVQSTRGGAAHQVDLLADKAWGTAYTPSECNAANGKYIYFYDKDGRRFQTAEVSGNYQVTGSYAQGAAGAGLDSVLQSATIGGGNYASGTYTYYYDAFNRRIAKDTPWSSTDEYFYDLGHQLLSDRGTDNIGSSAGSFPEDDYIWLGVSRFRSTWTKCLGEEGRLSLFRLPG